MNGRRALGLCAIAVATIATFPIGSVAQGKSLKDQLIGTWIYVSSTAKRDDGSNVQQPSSQGAVTYTSDGRFHFILTRTDLPKYASNDRTRPSPDEAMAIAAGALAYTGTIRWTKTRKPSTRTSRQARFQISPGPPISAGSSPRFPLTR
jgi:hypothetical protein